MSRQALSTSYITFSFISRIYSLIKARRSLSEIREYFHAVLPSAALESLEHAGETAAHCGHVPDNMPRSVPTTDTEGLQSDPLSFRLDTAQLNGVSTQNLAQKLYPAVSKLSDVFTVI
jgi:hypothetical protein